MLLNCFRVCTSGSTRSGFEKIIPTSSRLEIMFCSGCAHARILQYSARAEYIARAIRDKSRAPVDPVHDLAKGRYCVVHVQQSRVCVCSSVTASGTGVT